VGVAYIVIVSKPPQHAILLVAASVPFLEMNALQKLNLFLLAFFRKIARNRYNKMQ